MEDINLYLKFSFFIAGLIIVMMVAVGFFVIRGQSSQVRQQLLESGQSLLDQFEYNAEIAFRQDRSSYLKNAAQAAYQPEAGVMEAFVLNARQNIIAHNNPDRVGERFLSSKHDLVLTSNLQITGRGRFTVGLVLDPLWIDEALFQIRSSIFEITIVMVIVGLVAAGILAYFMVSPIETLTASVETIAEGNYGHQIEMKRSDEIGVLADSINNMSRKILKDRQELIEKQKMESELEVGQEIQKTFLPAEVPAPAEYSLDVTYRASRQVGGDLYDFIRLDKKRLGLFIADASGKGVPGALLMANTIATLRAIFRARSSHIKEAADLKKNIVMLNKICKDNFQKQSFVTLFSGVLNLETHEFDFVRCGHNPLLFYDSKREQIDIIESQGVSIGVVDSKMFEQQLEVGKIEFNKGDMIYQYSDGITEVKNDSGKLLGVEGVGKYIENNSDGPPAASDLFHLIAEEYIAQEAEYEDDVVIVSMKRV